MELVSETLAHSPLGGSGAHRWMVCPGSVTLSEGVSDPESEFAAEGSAAHALAEHCLSHGFEPWQFIGSSIYQKEDKSAFIDVNKNMADAVSDYIYCLERWHPKEYRNQGNTWIERKFHCPSIHDLFYGASDFVHQRENLLDVWDYKHGQGIVVEATDNPQLMYYACGVLEDLMLWDSVALVRLHIYQPRGWHRDGPHRYWEVPTHRLIEWLEDECIPAMERAMASRDAIAGGDCRFCPARFTQCPALMAAMDEYLKLILLADKKLEVTKVGNKEQIGGAEKLTAKQCGRIIQLNELNKIVLKAALQRGRGLMETGHDVPGCKLVKARTNREFKKGADRAAKRKYGDKALTKPVLKSPAQIDELPEGKKFTARWAFKPEGGTTIAIEEDPRRALKRDAKSLFKPVEKED